MVTEFTVFGSCACRDLFYSKINKNYKEYFSIGEDGTRTSFISLMQQPVNYNDKQLKIHPQNDENQHYSQWIKKDLDKNFLTILKNNNVEYILLDTYYDVNFGIIKINNHQYITKNLGIEKTDFYKNLKFKKVLTIQKNTLEYFALWKKHCNLFFDFLKKYCPDIKLILNPNRHVYNVLKTNGTIVTSKKFKSHCEEYNLYRNLLDEYILRNFDVDVLMFDENTLADENHMWGPFSLHYVPHYYVNMTKQLNEIIERNNKYAQDTFLINKTIREKKREIILSKFNLQYSKEFNEMKEKLNL